MSGLGQAEFKSLEAAVRDRLSTWTDVVEDLHFAVLDYPSTLERRLSQQLLEREMNDAETGDDPGRARMDYLFSLDKVVNPVLLGDDVVQPTTDTVAGIYSDVLKYGQPLPKRLTAAEQAELAEHRAVLYVENPDTGLLDTTPALALYQQLSLDVMRKTMALNDARANHGADSIEARMAAQELSFAETDLTVRGQKLKVEQAQSRIMQLSTNSGELWQRALMDLTDSMLMDAETTEQFPASRCPPVPETNWMQIDVDMRSAATGTVLGAGEKLLRLEAEIFLVPIDRSGWMQPGVLTSVPWKWGIMGRSGQLSDGQGGGDLPYLPQHLVLMREIKLTVQMPFEGDGDLPSSKLPKIGRMAVPLRVQAVDGRAIAAPQAQMMTARATVAKAATPAARAGNLRQMRTAQLMQQRRGSRALMAQLGALRSGAAVRPAPSAPKVQAVKAAVATMPQMQMMAAIRTVAAQTKPTVQPVSSSDMSRAVKAVNEAKKHLSRLQAEKRKLEKNGVVRALKKKKLREVEAKIRAAHTRIQVASKALKALQDRQKRYQAEQNRIAAEARKRAEAAEAKRRAEEEARRAEEARRRAPSDVAIDVHGLTGETWAPRRVTLQLRDRDGRVTTARTNAKGQARLRLNPGHYQAKVSQGKRAEETSKAITFDCAMGEPVAKVITILPKWKTVELKACDAGAEVLLFGYLLETLPQLPQVIDLATVDTEAPDLVG